AEKREAKALQAAQKATAKTGPAPKPAVEPAPVTGNLLRAAKQGTAKDVAEMAVELVTGGDEPDTVLELVLTALNGHKELSNTPQRSGEAALVARKRGEKASMAPSVNGQAPTQPVAAGAA